MKKFTPTIIVPPVDFPVSLAEAMDHLELPTPDTSAHVNKVMGFIAAASEYCENTQCRTYFTTTLEYTFPYWPWCGSPYWNNRMELPRATPLQSVESVTYKGLDGVSVTLDPATYLVDTDSEPGGIVLASSQSWPSTTLYPLHPIRVRYIAGHGAESPSVAFSACIKQAVLFIVGHLFENREGVTIGTLMESKEMAIGVAQFLRFDEPPNSF